MDIKKDDLPASISRRVIFNFSREEVIDILTKYARIKNKLHPIDIISIEAKGNTDSKLIEIEITGDEIIPIRGKNSDQNTTPVFDPTRIGTLDITPETSIATRI
jgi:hypothetical protein